MQWRCPHCYVQHLAFFLLRLRETKLFETKLLPVSSRNTAYQQYIDISTRTYKTVHFALYPKDEKREK